MTHWLTDSLTGVKCRATSVAKKLVKLKRYDNWVGFESKSLGPKYFHWFSRWIRPFRGQHLQFLQCFLKKRVIKHILNTWIELPLLHIVFKDALQKILRVYGGLCIYVWQQGRGIKGDQSWCCIVDWPLFSERVTPFIVQFPTSSRYLKLRRLRIWTSRTERW